VLIGATPEGRKELVGVYRWCPRERARLARSATRSESARVPRGLQPAVFLMLARRKSLDALLPILYLRGISTGDFQQALSALLGKDAPNLSPSVISGLKAQ